MMIPMGELLAKAKKEGYGVAAPNVFEGIGNIAGLSGRYKI